MRQAIVPRRRRTQALRKDLPAFVGRQWQSFVSVLELVGKELRSKGQDAVPLHRRLRLLRRGFTSESSLIYRTMNGADLSDYLSDWSRLARTARIDEPWIAILNDKLCFWGVMRNFSDHVAPVLGIVRDGRVVSLETGWVAPIASGLPRLAGKLVLKPCTGSGGSDVLVYGYDGDTHRLDGAPEDPSALVARLSADTWLACAFLEQAAYARAVWPGSTNTIRLLTLYDAEAGEAFLARAVHKFGRAGTGHVDNWEKGGISAEIDSVSGRLGQGFTFHPEGRLQAHDCHPDSGAPIKGLVVPGWPAVRGELLALASRLPFLPYVGWDVVVTDNGHAIIEGNNRPGVAVLQVHGPLLADPRVRHFYKYHRVI